MDRITKSKEDKLIRCAYDLAKWCESHCGAYRIGTDHQPSKCLRGNFEVQDNKTVELK